MKKTLLLGLCAALFSSVYADGLRILSVSDEFPNIFDPQLQGLGISSDGNYACGAFSWGEGVFVANLQTGEVKYEYALDDEGGELRHVDTDGVAVGLEYTYVFDSGVLTMNQIPEGYRSVLYEDLTADGKLIVGTLGCESLDTKAAYHKEGEDWKLLPTPPDEELFGLGPKLQSSCAKFVSDDGSVIFGFLGSFIIPIIWHRNSEGEYDYDFFVSSFTKLTQEDIPDENKPLWGLSAQYLNMSANGKYVSMLGVVKNEENYERFVAVVYDTETKNTTIYPYEQEVDPNEEGLYPSAISNDGTLIGCIGKPYFSSFGSFIIKPGETQAQLFTDVFPAYDKLLGESDSLGYSIPTAISADGKKILGYTYYSEDYYDEESYAYYVTYVISTDGDNAVEEVSSVPFREAVYSIEGQRLRGMTKGLNLVRKADGSFCKVLKK